MSTEQVKDEKMVLAESRMLAMAKLKIQQSQKPKIVPRSVSRSRSLSGSGNTPTHLVTQNKGIKRERSASTASRLERGASSSSQYQIPEYKQKIGSLPKAGPKLIDPAPLPARILNRTQSADSATIRKQRKIQDEKVGFQPRIHRRHRHSWQARRANEFLAYTMGISAEDIEDCDWE